MCIQASWKSSNSVLRTCSAFMAYWTTAFQQLWRPLGEIQTELFNIAENVVSELIGVHLLTSSRHRAVPAEWSMTSPEVALWVPRPRPQPKPLAVSPDSCSPPTVGGRFPPTGWGTFNPTAALNKPFQTVDKVVGSRYVMVITVLKLNSWFACTQSEWLIVCKYFFLINTVLLVAVRKLSNHLKCCFVLLIPEQHLNLQTVGRKVWPPNLMFRFPHIQHV